MLYNVIIIQILLQLCFTLNIQDNKNTIMHNIYIVHMLQMILWWNKSIHIIYILFIISARILDHTASWRNYFWGPQHRNSQQHIYAILLHRNMKKLMISNSQLKKRGNKISYAMLINHYLYQHSLCTIFS